MKTEKSPIALDRPSYGLATQVALYGGPPICTSGMTICSDLVMVYLVTIWSTVWRARENQEVSMSLVVYIDSGGDLLTLHPTTTTVDRRVN